MSSEPPAPNEYDADLTEDVFPDDSPVFSLRPTSEPTPDPAAPPEAPHTTEQQPETTLAENTIPESEKVFITRPFDPTEHNAKTRRVLAFTSLGVLVLFYGALLTFFVMRLITLQELTSIVAVFSGLQTLVAGAFGYYYAKDN